MAAQRPEDLLLPQFRSLQIQAELKRCHRANATLQFVSMRETFVYILSSRSRRLYIGVTSNLMRRLYCHRTGETGHTAKYKINRLVHFEIYSRPIDAIEREKRLKAWLRSRKVALIEKNNPTWDDLAADWFEPSRRKIGTTGEAGPPAAARPSG